MRTTINLDKELLNEAHLTGTKERTERTDLVFYDGTCGLCHGFVRFLLAEDPAGTRFRFAPLGGKEFAKALGGGDTSALPDSVVVRTADGEVLIRSRAVIHVLERLGGIWRATAIVARVFPVRLLDAAYDAIARIRHRIFARPKQACPILPPSLRSRFGA